ncbi:MAG: hypothetical protein U1C12_02630, partial [Patescibacteria group bacterium]|nr:hypothetical protein [Patescibacteria group bacterium]
AVVRNVSGATMSAGAAAYFVVSSPDGISVSNAGTTRKATFAGVLPTALSDSSPGRAQVYGICSAYMILNSTAVSATPGKQLDAVSSADYLKDFTVSDYFLSGALSGTEQGNPWNHVTLMDTFASAASANTTPTLKTVFVRAL